MRTRDRAREVARFLPDCAILFRRLAGDPRVRRRRKLLLVLLAVYLASPIDLIPDFIPVLGQLDDALLVVLVLRALVKGAGSELITEHWPGTEESLRVLMRAAGEIP